MFFISFSDFLQTVDGRNLATVRAVNPPAPPTFNIGAPPGPGPSKIKMKSVQDGFIPILNVRGGGGHLKSCKIESINRLKKRAYALTRDIAADPRLTRSYTWLAVLDYSRRRR